MSERIAATARKAMVALNRTLSWVRYAIYALRSMPRTRGNQRTLDTEPQYTKSDVAWFIGFCIGVLAFVNYAVTRNAVVSSLCFGATITLLIFSLFVDPSSLSRFPSA
jgi:hypothetical protein